MTFLIKSILLVIVFFMALIVFMPKLNMYNLLEKNIAKENIIISGETKKEKVFGLTLNGLELYYDSLYTSFIKRVDFTTFLLYSNINIKDIRVSKDFEKIVPSNIKEIDIKHSVLKFNILNIKAHGDFGDFKGELHIFDKKIVGELIPSKTMKFQYRKLLREFKFKDGKYKYEFSF